MQTTDNGTSGYAEIAGEAFGTIVDAMEAANARSTDYVRAVWGIVGRPYASTAIETVLADNAARTSALMSLTLDAIAENNRVAAELAREAARLAASVQESYVEVLRGAAETSVSNLNFVKNAAAQMQAQDLQVPRFN